MRFREIFGEAGRNLRAGVGAAPWVTLLLTALGALGIIVPQLSLLDAVTRAIEYQRSGAATLIVQATGRIDGERCDLFIELPNVQAAGAIRERANGVRLTLLPTTNVRYYETTPQFARLLGAAPRGSGVLLSHDVAAALGWIPDEAISISGDQIPVAGTYAYPEDGRVAGLGFALIGEIPAASALFDECWITVWPQTAEVEALASFVLAPTQGIDGTFDGPNLLPLNATLGNRFEVGPTQAIWISASPTAMVLAAITSFLFVRGRRLEFASARHVGVSREDQLSIIVTEGLVVAAIGLLVISPIAMFLITTAAPGLTEPLAWHAVRGAGAVLAGTAAGSFLGAITIRERRLFRYFRER